MKKRRLKKTVVPFIYLAVIITFIASIFLIETSIEDATFEEKEDYDYVSETIFDNEVPVVNTEVLIKRPYNDTEITVLKNYYDYQADEQTQQNSIIYHENTYLQNSGVIYGGKDNFDVISILDGEVVNIKEDSLLGTIIEIKHSNEMISIYQSLSEVTVKVNDMVSQGQIIAKSGTSNLNPDLNSHLLFELIVKGQTVNPENYYDKNVNEI